MAHVGDPERERAALRLRRHYAEGRLDDGELAERLELVLRARSRVELAYALRGLPFLDELAARGQHALLVGALGAVWLMLTAAMLVAFVVWVAANGASLAAFLAFPLAWVALTLLLRRRLAASRRRLPRP